MSISPVRTVRIVAVEIPGATRILEELGIDYCCGGNRSLADACLNAGVSVGEVLAKLEEAEQSKDVAPEFVDWNKASLSDLVWHIVDRHHVFTWSELERLGPVTVKVCAAHGGNHPELLTILEVFSDLKQELVSHMKKEELVLFPYICELDEAVADGGILRMPFFGSVFNPIRIMLAEHDRAGDALKKIRELSADFSVPADGCASYRELYRALEALEADLHLHIHLENNILFPGAIRLENL